MFDRSTLAKRGVTLASALTVLLACGCSLIKIDTGVTPLPKKDLQARILTREFAAGYVASVVIAADEIAAETNDSETLRDTIRWKLGTSTAAREAALRTDPKIALADTWAMTIQMRAFFESGAGKDAFPIRHDEIVAAAREREAQFATIARAVTSSAEFGPMERFVFDFADSFPLRSLAFEREPILAHWNTFRGDAILKETPTVGTAPEVASDLSERVSLFGRQIPDEIRWRTQLFAIESDYSIEDLRKMLDRVDAELQRIATVAENSPELARESVRELREGLLPLIEELDGKWRATLDALSAEREAIAESLTAERQAVTVTLKEERAAVMADAHRIATEVTDKSWQEAQKALHKILIGQVVVTIVVLGLPFLFGFIAGRAVGRRRQGT